MLEWMSTHSWAVAAGVNLVSVAMGALTYPIMMWVIKE